MPKIVENEEYLNTKEAMEVLEVSRQLFYSNARPYLKAYHFNAKKTPWYRKRDVIALRDGKPIRNASIALGGIQKDWTVYLTSLGFRASTELNLVESSVSLPQEAVEFFGLSEDGRFVKRSRRTLANGVPICTWDTYYPVELVGDVIDQMKHDMSFDVVAYIREKHGIVVGHAKDKYTARITNPGELNLFQLPTDDAVLILQRVSYTRDKKVLVLYSHMVLLSSWFAPEHEYDVKIWDEAS